MISHLPALDSLTSNQFYLVRKYNGNTRDSSHCTAQLLTQEQTTQQLHALCDHECTGEKDTKLGINSSHIITMCDKCNFFVFHNARCWKSYRVVPKKSLFWNWFGSGYPNNDLICVQTIVLDKMDAKDESSHVMRSLVDYETMLNTDLYYEVNRHTPDYTVMYEVHNSAKF